MIIIERHFCDSLVGRTKASIVAVAVGGASCWARRPAGRQHNGSCRANWAPTGFPGNWENCRGEELAAAAAAAGEDRSNRNGDSLRHRKWRLMSEIHHLQGCEEIGWNLAATCSLMGSSRGLPGRRPPGGPPYKSNRRLLPSYDIWSGDASKSFQEFRAPERLGKYWPQT